MIVTSRFKALPYRNNDTAKPKFSAMNLQGLVFLDRRSGEVLANARDMETDLSRKMYCGATHQMRCILVHGVRR
jgi:hypothetical protein